MIERMEMKNYSVVKVNCLAVRVLGVEKKENFTFYVRFLNWIQSIRICVLIYTLEIVCNRICSIAYPAMTMKASKRFQVSDR